MLLEIRPGSQSGFPGFFIREEQSHGGTRNL
jgi:hypothetical protein